MASEDHHFGFFGGLSSEPISYYSRVPGPVSFQFRPQVILTLSELKVIKYAEPPLILRGDLMATTVLGNWPFLYLGISPKDRGDKVAFICGTEVAKIPLICWP